MERIKFSLYKIKVHIIFFIKYNILDKMKWFIYHNFKKKNFIKVTDAEMQSIIESIVESTSKSGKLIAKSLKDIKRRVDIYNIESV